MPSSTFWNRTAKRYSSSPIADPASYEKKLELMRNYFRPDMNLLEFGCGTGSTALIHAPYVKHIDAYDISQNMIEIANSKQAKEGIQNISFQTKSIEEMEIEENSMDMILGLSILHLLKDKEAAIQKAYSWLKPGGLFVTSTVCLSSYKILPRLMLNLASPIARPLGLLPLVKSFAEDELVDCMKKSGFVTEHQWQPNPGVLFLIMKKPD